VTSQGEVLADTPALYPRVPGVPRVTRDEACRRAGVILAGAVKQINAERAEAAKAAKAEEAGATG
jgi:hypothetical protein